jgi:alginate O-acetyltransferase complex protein AlgI
MLFCSSAFLLFFAVVFSAYWALPWPQARVWLLVGASLYFYASWNAQLALVILASTTFDYLVARGIEAASAPRRRRWIAALSVVSNLGLLGYFKYMNFFLGSLEQALRVAGASVSLPLLSVILPIGVSFYTFEAINYVVDVAAGRVKAERNYANFLLFILFFPHLVAGPIVRARDFLPQIQRPKRWNWVRVQLGLRLFAVGLFKKFVIADRMALFVDPVFADPHGYGTAATWLAFLAYPLQIYGDFSGYTDMAIGVAYLLGYRLARNFDMPYLAANVAEFWRRWHISLSSWLRDYLFIPLGGSRGGRWRTYRNLLVTMTLGGLWHGASWTFVVWGVLHGLLLIGHRLFQQCGEGRPWLRRVVQAALGNVGGVLVTFLCVSVCWVFFRAPTFDVALAILRGLATVGPGKSEPLPAVGLLLTGAVLLGGWLVVRNDLWRKAAERLPALALGMLDAGLLAVCLLFAPPVGQPFIYFQF